MNINSEQEYKEFIEVATMLKYYKLKGVPIPEEVLEMLAESKEESDVLYVLNEIATK